MIEYIYTPCLGQIMDITTCSDRAFAEKQMGDGMLVVPESRLVCAPCGGKIEQIFVTNHAFTMTSNSGAELLVHIGVDTVQLHGICFRRLIEPNRFVERGTPIIETDFDLIRQNGLDTSVIIVYIGEAGRLSKTKLHRCDSLETPLFSIDR